MKGKTTIALSRDTVKDIITLHVQGMVLGNLEVTGFEVHRNGAIDVEVKFVDAAPALPLGDGQGGGS